MECQMYFYKFLHVIIKKILCNTYMDIRQGLDITGLASEDISPPSSIHKFPAPEIIPIVCIEIN